ncbi:MAG: ATP-dependent DNA helicase RecG [Pseudomonadota bacterium]
MRADELTPLFADLVSLSGIGEKTGKAFARLVKPSGIERPRILDLLLHLPTGLVDRRARPPVAQIEPGTVATVSVRITEHQAPPRGSRAPYRVVCEDESGSLTLVYFRAQSSYMERQMPVGSSRIVSGRAELFNGMIQMVHPDHVVQPEDAASLPLLEPVYPLTAGVTNALVRRAMGAALERVPELNGWLDETIAEREGWPAFQSAMERVHRPDDPHDQAPEGECWSRLAYDELLAGQLALQILRRSMKKRGGTPRPHGTEAMDAIIADLPFALTGSQRDAVEDIRRDLASPDRMLRLLQGDVGAGKTIVALLAMAAAISSGAQAAMMAPTEILARQHLATLSKLAEPAGFRVGILTGREKGAERADILERLSSGEIDILVGTHAIFQAGVAFQDLGFAIIDEQHRFGVHQRLALAGKGQSATDLLIMTATPIPRTLVLTYYGDMDVSKLTEKPAGRQPIETRLVDMARTESVVDRLAAHVADGGQAYWVCALVEDADMVEATSAETRYDRLRERLGDAGVALIHGRMSGAEKDRTMAAFANGEIAVLVATTVIEVGVDVPNATIMIIENGERFGLAQLHQLRGRVGRGSKASTCLLLYQRPLSETAEARLRMMRASDDGFAIAEEDLRLRGGGEVLGTRQSGNPLSRIARPEAHGRLLDMAQKDARLALDRDPDLSTERGRALRLLLQLFERDEAIRLIEAG